MKEIFKEFAKHYLGIAAAILIAVLIGIFLKEPKISVGSIVLGVFGYIIFLGIAIFVFLVI